MTQALARGGQDEFTDMSNRIATNPTVLPPTSRHGSILIGDEQNAKLAVGSTWPGMGKMGHLVDLRCLLLVRGIGLWGPELGEPLGDGTVL